MSASHTSRGTKPRPLVAVKKQGLYCAAGDFYIDPWGKVPKAVITHGHADHARSGSGEYYCAQSSVPILNQRLYFPENDSENALETHEPAGDFDSDGNPVGLTDAGESLIIVPPWQRQNAAVKGIAYGEKFRLGDAWVSFHPAGHIRGSAQVRIEADGQVWVISGDYKRDDDPTAEPFEVVPCDALITEATFGLPIYRWQPGSQTAQDVLDWWDENRTDGKTSLLFCYALGKAQRLMGELAQITDRPVYIHGAVKPLADIYRAQGVKLLDYQPTTEMPRNHKYEGELVLSPPSGHRSVWMKRFRNVSTAFASGWMAVRGNRRRRGYDRGFVMSDHADWPGLIRTVRDCGAKQVFVTHGSKETLSRYIREEMGVEAVSLDTLYESDED